MDMTKIFDPISHGDTFDILDQVSLLQYERKDIAFFGLNILHD